MRDFNLKEMNEKFIFKVNFKGKKRKKLSCPPGYHPNSEGTACVPMTGEMKKNLRLGARDAKRTKKEKGTGFVRRVAAKYRRAMKHRKSMGL